MTSIFLYLVLLLMPQLLLGAAAPNQGGFSLRIGQPNGHAVKTAHDIEIKVLKEALEKIPDTATIQNMIAQLKIVPSNVHLALAPTPDQGRIIAGTTGAAAATISMATYGVTATNCCLLIGSCAALYPEKARTTAEKIKEHLESPECAACAETALECCLVTVGGCLYAVYNPYQAFKNCKKMITPDNMYRD